MPYGTPCGEDLDPVRARLAELEDEIEELRKELKVPEEIPPRWFGNQGAGGGGGGKGKKQKQKV